MSSASHLVVVLAAAASAFVLGQSMNAEASPQSDAQIVQELRKIEVLLGNQYVGDRTLSRMLVKICQRQDAAAPSC